MCIEEVRRLSANDVGQVVLLVVVPVALFLAVHRELVVVILGVAHETVPYVPARWDVLHAGPRLGQPVLVQVLASVECGISLCVISYHTILILFSSWSTGGFQACLRTGQGGT